MTASKKRSRWPMIGTVSVAIATVVGGAVTLLEYVRSVDSTQIQQQRDWAARAALLDYRMGEAERDITWLREQHQHDIDQLRQECRP